MYETTMDEQSSSRIPIQAAPIDRSPSGAAAFGVEAGVNASQDWGSILSTGLSVLPGILGAFGI